MSSYIRKLSYLYYYENQKRGVNSGYVRLERRNSNIRFQMNIRFRVMDDMPLILYLYGKQKNGRWVLIPLGNCQIKNRQLIMRFIKSEKEILPDGITLEDIYGVFLPLKGNRCFAGNWNDRDGNEYFRFMDWIGTKEPEEVLADSDEAEEEAAPDYAGSGVDVPIKEADNSDAEMPRGVAGLTNSSPGTVVFSQSAVRNMETKEGTEEFSVEEKIDSAREDFSNEVYDKESLVKEEDESEVHSSEIESMEWTPPEQAKEWLPVWEEKITPELVFSVYPSLPEFLFCKKCIRIEPQDIGILPMESWFLASNSFLLHGYYNFNHLLLGWKTDKPEAFILGVPGIYDRREKIMAAMFGFESFEIMGRRDPEKSPIPEGAMGYWYRRIEPSLRQENK